MCGVTYQVGRDGGGDQCVGAAHQGPTEEQHGCGKQRELRTEPGSTVVRAGIYREGTHPMGPSPEHKTNGFCDVPGVGDALSCFPKATEACLEGLELKFPGLMDSS